MIPVVTPSKLRRIDPAHVRSASPFVPHQRAGPALSTTAHAPTTAWRPGRAADARRVDDACVRFEAAWRAGRAPRIEDFLPDRDEADASPFLFELIALERELRRDGGECPDLLHYHARFPEAPEAVEAAFRDGTPDRPPGDRPGGVGRFGDYDLLEEVARGGMGIVHRARHRALDRVVALKTILTGRSATESEIRRFRIEAAAAARLDHPHIVPVYEVGCRSNVLFYSMKWVGGGDLARGLDRFVGNPEATAQLLVPIARAVHHAHARGVVHRDLKPSNILLEENGRPLVADFGLAKRVGNDSGATASGAAVGTPAYMAPEQVEGGAISPATDVYGLGAILYQLLTGRPPFLGGSPAEVLTRVIEQDPMPPARLRPGIPRELEQVCLKCLEKRPKDRYASAADLADDLERYLQGEGIVAGRAGLVGHLRRWGRREPELAARAVGQSALLLLTQINHLLDPDPDSPVHWAVTAVEGSWLAATLAIRLLAGADRSPDRIRAAWMVLDVTLLTVILRLLGAATSSLIVGYPLLIAASGLWRRPWLVWWTTGLAILGYGALALDAWRLGMARVDNHYPNILLLTLAVTGYVITQLIRRVGPTRALDPIGAGHTTGAS